MAFLAGAVVVLILGVILALVVEETPADRHRRGEEVCPLVPQEQAYAPRIQFTGIQMAHSTNFLNQEFTFVAGTIVNGGDKAIVACKSRSSSTISSTRPSCATRK